MLGLLVEEFTRPCRNGLRVGLGGRNKTTENGAGLTTENSPIRELAIVLAPAVEPKRINRSRSTTIGRRLGRPQRPTIPFPAFGSLGASRSPTNEVAGDPMVGRRTPGL